MLNSSQALNSAKASIRRDRNAPVRSNRYQISELLLFILFLYCETIVFVCCEPTGLAHRSSLKVEYPSDVAFTHLDLVQAKAAAVSLNSQVL